MRSHLYPMQAGERADQAMQSGTERSAAGLADEARVLLDQAGAAQSVSEGQDYTRSCGWCC